MSDRRAGDGPAGSPVEYDEFGLFHENAAEFGIPYDGPPDVRRESVEVGAGRSVSALVWGPGDPGLVLLHGGAQNAHTWDTVALALARPLVAVDLPGHGHSDRATGRDPVTLATDLATVLDALAPTARAVVGMSLGGLAAIALADARPDLVHRLVLVDVSPGVDRDKARAVTDFVRGPATFPDFDALLARTREHNPTRSVASLRRGILHNAVQRPDGSWVWRYRRDAQPIETGYLDEVDVLWDALGRSTAPVLLARGMRSGSVVDDADVAELLRRRPDAAVVEFADAGHSIQGTMPVELARAIAAFAG